MNGCDNTDAIALRKKGELEKTDIQAQLHEEKRTMLARSDTQPSKNSHSYEWSVDYEKPTPTKHVPKTQVRKKNLGL